MDKEFLCKLGKKFVPLTSFKLKITIDKMTANMVESILTVEIDFWRDIIKKILSLSLHCCGVQFSDRSC